MQANKSTYFVQCSIVFIKETRQTHCNPRLLHVKGLGTSVSILLLVLFSMALWSTIDHEKYFSILSTRNKPGEIPSYEMNIFSESSLLENICHIRVVFILN
jgi:hypothetical protein